MRSETKTRVSRSSKVGSVLNQIKGSAAALTIMLSFSKLNLLGLIVSATLLFQAPSCLAAATLQSETLEAWHAYVERATADLRMQAEPGRLFLSVNEKDGTLQKIQQGQPLVTPSRADMPIKVSGGLIHDWVGTIFVPNVSMTEVVAVLRDYDHYKDFYAPTVVTSKLERSFATRDSFSMLLSNRVLVKSALQCSYQASYTKIDDHRWYSITEATDIEEITKYGSPQEHASLEDQGTGLIWRLANFVRLQERDSGVFIQVETIALSRTIPASLSWLVVPTVNRVAKSTITVSLRRTQEAVQKRMLEGQSAKQPEQRLNLSGDRAALHGETR